MINRNSIFALLLVLSGCGAAQAPASGGIGDPLDPANLYPLQEGNVWAYDVNTGLEGDLPVLGQTRVVSAEGNVFSVSTNRSEPVLYERRPDGIFRTQSGTWLLRGPIRVGASWEASAGLQASVVSVSESVETASGAYEGCVRVEESSEQEARSTSTVYCPGVGPVLVESVMESRLTRGAVRVTATLRGYQLAESP